MQFLTSTAAMLLMMWCPLSDAAAADILAGDGAVELTLEAPFAELFSHTEEDDYRVVGSLTYDDATTGRRVTVDPVEITLRGHTSRRLSECPFPKLKVSFGSAPRADTAFAGLQALKLGTHCGERGDDDLTPKYGRLANERAPHREALVYAILHAAGIPTLRARPARLTYISTDAADREPLVRNALLLEDDEDARRRFDATGDVAEQRFTSASDRFRVSDTARLAFAQALIGNFDWCLRFFPGDIYRCDDRHPLWNVLALVRRDTTVLPLIYDFDLAGPVVGRHVWFRQVFDTAFAASGSATEVEVLAQLQRTRSLFGRDTLEHTRRAFLATRQAVTAAIERATVDQQGRALAQQYADTFFAIVENGRRFYMPLLVEGGAHPALDVEGSRLACVDATPAPAGTPVSEPLESRDGMIRVRLLDALWQWTGKRRCDAVHREPVWIPADAIGTEYPR